LPRAVAEAPKIINIREKPMEKKMLEKSAAERFFLRLSKEIPVIKLRYPGMSGRIQGDKNVNNPAVKAEKSFNIGVIL
jgi:hypothetical protein